MKIYEYTNFQEIKSDYVEPNFSNKLLIIKKNKKLVYVFKNEK